MSTPGSLRDVQIWIAVEILGGSSSDPPRRFAAEIRENDIRRKPYRLIARIISDPRPHEIVDFVSLVFTPKSERRPG